MTRDLQLIHSVRRQMASHHKYYFQKLCQLFLMLLLLTCMGCSRRYSDLPAFFPVKFADGENQSVGRFKTSYLAEQIDEYYRGSNPGPLGVTTFVNVDDLHSTSTFGRMVSEQLISELSMRGFEVVELRHADSLQFMERDGEFALSRSPGSVRRERELGGVIVGTYIVSPVRVYLNARLIDPSSSMILSAGSVEMSKTSELARLLRGGAMATGLERIPVRHIGIASYPLSMFPNRAQAYDAEESAPTIGRVPTVSRLDPPVAEFQAGKLPKTEPLVDK